MSPEEDMIRRRAAWATRALELTLERDALAERVKQLEAERDKALLAVTSASTSVMYLDIQFIAMRRQHKGHHCDYRRMIDAAIDVIKDMRKNLSFHPENNVYSSIVRQRDELRKRIEAVENERDMEACKAAKQ